MALSYDPEHKEELTMEAHGKQAEATTPSA
jgi:hypothetical protein